MPLLRRGSLLPVKGLDFSQPSTFIDDRSGFPKNVQYDRSELRKRVGKSQIGGQVASATTIMGLGVLELNSGTKHLVRASTRNLERFNTATSQWNSIALTLMTGDTSNFFSFATITEDGIMIITNGFDVIRKWNGGGNVSALGGNPPKAKYCTYISPYTMVAHLDESGSVSPWKIAWSDTNNPEEWTTGNAGAHLVSRDPSPIQNIAKLNEFVAVYKKESLELGRLIDTADVFKFDPIKTGVGLGAPRAFVDAEGQHYFMGLNDFHTWNGAAVDPIGKPVREEVFSRIDRNLIDRCFAVQVQEQNEVWFFIVISGFQWPTEVWKYNYKFGFWYQDTCNLLTAGVKYERVNTLAWDDALLTWDQQTTVWDASVNIENWEEVVFGSSTGYTHKLDYNTTDDSGIPVNAEYVTKDFIGEHLEEADRWLRLDVWCRGNGRLYVDYSDDFGSTWVNIPYTSSQAWLDLTAVSRKYEWYFDVWGEHVRFRFRNERTKEVFYLRSVVPLHVAREEVRSFR